MNNNERIHRSVAKLLVEANGSMVFAEDATPKLRTLIEIGARSSAERAADVLVSIVEMSMALRAGGHRAAADLLTDLLKRSAAAMRRLAILAEHHASAHVALSRFSERTSSRRAPLHDATVAGVKLRDLLPPGMGRRPDKRR